MLDLNGVISRRLCSRASLLTNDPHSSFSTSSFLLPTSSESFQFHWDKQNPHCWVLTEVNKLFLQSVLPQDQAVFPSNDRPNRSKMASKSIDDTEKRQIEGTSLLNLQANCWLTRCEDDVEIRVPTYLL